MAERNSSWVSGEETPLTFPVYHKGGGNAMKRTRKLRRFLQVMLFVNFMVGIYTGMKALNLVAVLSNGALVLALAFLELKRR